MNVSGINIIALLVAAIAVYVTGLIIYGFLIPSETWMAWSDINPEDMERIGMSRMPLSPIMPLLIATGIALVVKWRQIDSVGAGAATGFMLSLFFLVGGRLYGYVYGVEGLNILALDSAHLLLNGIAAGAVLGGWPNRAYSEA